MSIVDSFNCISTVLEIIYQLKKRIHYCTKPNLFKKHDIYPIGRNKKTLIIPISTVA